PGRPPDPGDAGGGVRLSGRARHPRRAAPGARSPRPRVMRELTHLLAFDFVRHALLAGLLASVLCGVVGTFVVVKRLVFISGGISHAAFGGLGFCYWLGVDYRWGAGLVAIGSAVALARAGEGRGRSHDAPSGT